MTNVNARATSPDLSRAHVSWIGVFRSEWTKLWSLRSTYYILAIAVLFMIGLSFLIALGIREGLQQAGGIVQVPGIGDAISEVSVWLSLQGIRLAQLAVGVLGVLVVTGEYSSGMIRATMAAVPTRVPVLVSKALIVIIAIFVVMVPAGIAAFLLAQSVLAELNLSAQLSDPGVMRIIIGAALYLCAVGVIGSALAWLLRNAAGAIFALVAVLILLPVLLPLIQLDWVQTLSDYLPSTAGQSVFGPTTGTNILPADMEIDADPFGPWEGYAIMVAWCVVALAASAWTLIRRDA
jgi:ABC-type transport system involved in multi-copper enzyme maturation permease subunit